MTMRQSRLTKQKKAILEIIQSACYHPNAEQIYQLAKKNMPKISVGTVYRNLDILTQQNLIRRIDIPGEPVRFDSDFKNKAYFVCKNKGTIYDLKIDPKKIMKLFRSEPVIESIDGFNIILSGSSKNDREERKLRKGQVKKPPLSFRA